jgi:hypothetical protein
MNTRPIPVEALQGDGSAIEGQYTAAAPVSCYERFIQRDRTQRVMVGGIMAWVNGGAWHPGRQDDRMPFLRPALHVGGQPYRTPMPVPDNVGPYVSVRSGHECRDPNCC